MEEKIPGNEEMEAHIRELLSGDPEKFDEIEKYISAVEAYYCGNLSNFAFREAIRSGASNYVEAHAGNFDLNDTDGYSSYLYETDDSDMQEILMNHGAFKFLGDYADCRFAIETINGDILAFDSDFQREVFEEYLKYTGLTKEKIIQMLADDYDEYKDEDLPEDFDRCVDDDFSALGISLSNGEICFGDLVGYRGYDTKKLIEELGWGCSFEGDSWRFETDGVYFID